ncbi:MAG: TetR/AcrR family transcriptional regulator [Leifsonia sp.]
MTDASAAQPGSRGAYAKSAARRRELVEAATVLFGRTGYRGATMLQIAEACNISRTGLLHHFPTKESLLEAVLQARDESDARRMADAGDPDDARTALRNLVALVEHNTTIPAILNLFSVLAAEAADPSHPAHTYFVRRYVNSRRNIQDSFERARDEGILAPDLDPAVFTIELISLMDGLQVQWLLDPTHVDMVAIVDSRIRSALTVSLD